MQEKCFKIIETMKEDEILEYLKKKFDENNIKYRIELQEIWEGNIIPNYIGKFVVYVEEQFKGKAEKLLNQYYANNKIIIEESNEEDDETEKESKKINKKQKMAMRIYLGIVICMVLSIIIAATFA